MMTEGTFTVSHTGAAGAGRIRAKAAADGNASAQDGFL